MSGAGAGGRAALGTTSLQSGLSVLACLRADRSTLSWPPSFSGSDNSYTGPCSLALEVKLFVTLEWTVVVMSFILAVVPLYYWAISLPYGSDCSNTYPKDNAKCPVTLCSHFVPSLLVIPFPFLHTGLIVTRLCILIINHHIILHTVLN